MKTNSISTIVFIGSGNVAYKLAEAFKYTGRKIIQVYSRTEISAKGLASLVNAGYTTDLNNIEKGADVYIISVSDTAVPEIVKNLKLGKSLVVHTSGFLSMDILYHTSKNIGVFYPLQTLSKNRIVDFLSIPVCIEANNEDNLVMLEDLARSFSTDVRYVDSSQRKLIHLAAVFASNYTNQMYCIAEEILKDSGIPFDILKPLILETAEKIMNMDPYEAQTGPARRNDTEVINQHLKMLKNNDYKEFYKMLSEMIAKKYKKNGGE
ncbi:MAG: DUF2520 domain-containing protein [Bacteroidales bacterium]|jgi:predicted short-subunit dehydrogenase-like oxidoreductase (DUF2520 family)